MFYRRSKSSRAPLHALRRNSKDELSRQFISCVVPLQNHISPTTIPPTGTGRTIRLFIPRDQRPALQFRYCLCSCMELSFLEFAVGFVVNYKHSATIPSRNGGWRGLSPLPYRAVAPPFSRSLREGGDFALPADDRFCQHQTPHPVSAKSAETRVGQPDKTRQKVGPAPQSGQRSFDSWSVYMGMLRQLS